MYLQFGSDVFEISFPNFPIFKNTLITLFSEFTSKHLTKNATSYKITTTSSYFNLLKENKKICQSKSKLVIILSLCFELTEKMIHLDEKNIILHSAVLQKKGTTVLIPGDSGIGKTTSSIILLNNGFNYISDECFILTPNDTLIHFPRYLLVSPQTYKLIKQYNFHKDITSFLHQKYKYYYYQQKNISTLSEFTYEDCLVFIPKHFNRDNNLSLDNKLMYIYNSLFSFPKHISKGTPQLIKLAKNCKWHELDSENPVEFGLAISRIVN